MSPRRALHPVESRLLAQLRPALVRALASRRRVRERHEEYRCAVDLAAEDGGDAVYVEHAQRAKALAESVQSLANETLADAVFEAFGVGDDEDLEALLARSLEVVKGGR